LSSVQEKVLKVLTIGWGKVENKFQLADEIGNFIPPGGSPIMKMKIRAGKNKIIIYLNTR